MKEKITENHAKAKEFFLEKISFMLTPYELKEMIANNLNEINIIDVRAYDDYIDGHIPYAIHIPFDSIEEHLVMLEKDKTNIVYGYSEFCKLPAKACYIIATKNYPVMLLRGGYHIWEKIGFDTIKTSSDK